jgi:aspartate kinase
MLVMKFGGTSVGSGSAILHVAAVILDHQHRHPFVVTSAMSGVTDTLLRLADSEAAGNVAAAWEQVRALREHHIAAAGAIDPDSSWHRLHRVLEDLEAVVRQAPAREKVGSRASAARRDRIAAFGELLAVTLVAGALEKHGAAAVACLGPLILTDDRFGEAAPQMEGTAEAARQLLALVGPAIPVTAGFIGCTRDGQVTTLGRGGSDYSATLLAGAVSAEACWIYTDVDGVFSADPRIVPEARVLPHISAATAGRLSFCGAQVLHPRSVAPAARAGIELRVRNTFRPQHNGTLIAGGRPDTEALLGHPLAVVGRRNLASVGLVGSGLAEIPHVFGRLCRVITEAGAEIIQTTHPVPGHDPEVIVDDAYVGEIESRLAHEFSGEWRASLIHAFTVRGGLAQLCLLGDDLHASTLASTQRSLAEAEVEWLQQTASADAICFIVEEILLDRAIRCLHQDMIVGARAPLAS